MSQILAVTNLESSYGQTKVLNGLDFGLEEGGVT